MRERGLRGRKRCAVRASVPSIACAPRTRLHSIGDACGAEDIRRLEATVHLVVPLLVAGVGGARLGGQHEAGAPPNDGGPRRLREASSRGESDGSPRVSHSCECCVSTACIRARTARHALKEKPACAAGAHIPHPPSGARAHVRGPTPATHRAWRRCSWAAMQATTAHCLKEASADAAPPRHCS
jgi:hypothetical protein